jgi:uncharacterized membrane protein
MNLYLQLLVSLLTIALFFHACLRISLSNALRLFLISLLFSFFAENLGMRWDGLAGSRYGYNPALHPTLPGGVPVFIVLTWFILSYNALVFLHSISIRLKDSFSIHRLLLKGSLCALYITATDFFLDPLGTSFGVWAWFEPGGYYGTPWHNFGGWFVLGFFISVVYLWWEKPLPNDRMQNRLIGDGIVAMASIFLTMICLAACFIRLGHGWPVVLSLLVKGPVWFYWAISLKKVRLR